MKFSDYLLEGFTELQAEAFADKYVALHNELSERYFDAFKKIGTHS